VAAIEERAHGRNLSVTEAGDIPARELRRGDLGARRVAYVDIDVHHGDGVQAAFYDDPRVLTISIHESPLTLFPGTGWPAELGTGAAQGTSVNLALPPGTSDAAWLRAFHAVVPGLVPRRTYLPAGRGRRGRPR